MARGSEQLVAITSIELHRHGVIEQRGSAARPPAWVRRLSRPSQVRSCRGNTSHRGAMRRTIEDGEDSRGENLRRAGKDEATRRR
eukprot:CAMPEP_0119364694 /NCGR_PEP_ID=MMETSP1334-20130426/11612_1 /TAXON_ID=127549 /ORGANISM="Calcidiscus leptoporus, Strain RCC1130" /LENGTH=84 /DNA_ID=CAMNT_0007380467 /DNA_START=431 /DNA_END=685 /DNA_ORIENTATION=+